MLPVDEAHARDEAPVLLETDTQFVNEEEQRMRDSVFSGGTALLRSSALGEC